MSQPLKAKPLIRPLPGPGLVANTTTPPPPLGAGVAGRVPRPSLSSADNSIYTSGCPAQRALDAIASKWAILVLHRLRNGPVRFNALQRELDGVSQKVLAQQLRKLESFGLVTRTAHPTVPPSVEYALTPAAIDLKGALSALCEWADRHLPPAATRPPAATKPATPPESTIEASASTNGQSHSPAHTTRPPARGKP